MKSVKTEENANDMVKDMTNLMSEGGFRLTKWSSNKRSVLQNIKETERSKSLVDLDLDTLDCYGMLTMTSSPSKLP